MSAPVNFYCSSAAACSRPAMSTAHSPSTSYLNSYQKAFCGHYSSLGRCHFAPWNGLRQLGITISPKPSKLGRDGSSKRMTVRASLFGVGAPEALVIGVVALLVFGPKGLAEVARNLGKTLRAFQPTIRELQDVSREFKSTLEKEIGLDDIPSSSSNTYNPRKVNSVSDSSTSGNEDSRIATDPNGAPPNRAYSTEDFLRITEEQLKASTAQQQEVASPPEASQAEPPTQTLSQPPAAVHDTASAAPPTQKPENKS